MFDIIPNRKKNRDLFDFDNFFSEFFPDNFFPSMDSRFMRIDIKELTDNYVFDIELPGVKKEDIEISIVDDVFTINVKKLEEKEENTKFIRKERRYGSLSRSFAIPNIDKDNVRAKFEDGILTVLLPKLTPVEPPKKTIDIE